jgi:molybdopterin-guanine dinucleotide biosynthesis protein A
MGTDKSLLDYHGKPQRYHLYNMLKDLCEDVYISSNADQYAGIPSSFNALPDNERFGDIGPMAGLLSAFELFPSASFLAVGCDYPLLQREDLQDLINASWEVNSSVAYFNSDTGFFEPLVAIYHNNIKASLYKRFALKEYSLRRLLEAENTNKLIHFLPERLQSVDTWQEYENLLGKIKQAP